ncbi:MAG: trypsin-like peptidase domain-containing protein [Longimicrobiales bacterium]|nr:trypsin-like peptidase domain-containing protein [Longimicrobiales bacterium]
MESSRHHAARLLRLLCAGLAAVAAPGAAQGRVQDAQRDSLSFSTAASLEQLAAAAMPAVVLIDVTTAADTRQGSGFLIDPDGRILTNEHVIRDARSARVKLPSGDVYEDVDILTSDPRRDIAVLRIPGFDLPALELGNSDSVRIGTGVVLIGSPLGLENTVSTGIVSGRRQEPEGYQLIQISAPASRGSSGGPVLSGSGRVIGIAVSQIQAGQNLNFAVPINYARGLLTNLPERPLTVLRAPAPGAELGSGRPTPTLTTVNRGLDYGVDDFAGYRIETLTVMDANRERRTRITVRRIETVGGGEPRIERYLESETVATTETFGTVQILRRERSRAVVRLRDLDPVSVRGEVTWWRGGESVTASHDLRFQDGRAVGIITDTAGGRVELDRELPRGIILRSTRDVGLAVLRADSLVGRSVEFVTFDPWTGEVDHERYDVLEAATAQVRGQEHAALRVNVATGLDNESLLVRADPPRLILRRMSADELTTEEVTLMEIFPAAGGGDG